tara:strand:- start:5325 stop:6143 length:819 start_codon:yes stop_codon:yes gene_type:complete
MVDMNIKKKFMSGCGSFPGTRDFSFNESLSIEKVTRTPIVDDSLYSKIVIPFFGDSFTYGSGIEYEYGLTNVIQQYLGDKYFSLNLGSPGFSLDGIIRIISQYYNRTDITHSEVMVVSLPPLSRREHFCSETVDYSNTEWRHAPMRDADIEYMRLLPEAENFTAPAWKAYIETINPLTDIINLERNLVFISNFAAARGIKVILWNDVHLHVNQDDRRDIIEFIDDLGITLLTIDEIHRYRQSYVISKDDGHYNSLGMKVIADVILNSVKQYL